MEFVKILFVTIFGWCVGNTEGMTVGNNGIITTLPTVVAQMIVPSHNQVQLDFNSIFTVGTMIPRKLQPKLHHNPTIGAPDRACVYFTVMNNGNPNNANALFQNATVVNPIPANEVNIYFPTDGSQPTTPEAVEYSCANIDNRENSPITEWYMMMFGVIPFQNTGNSANDYVKAGWNAGATVVQQIISFDASVNGADIVKDPDSGALVSKKDFFVQNFRRIASTSVGRVLLYRILIEIRRHTSGINIGCLENIIPPHSNLLIRNGLRSIKIIWNNLEFYFDWPQQEIGINNITTNLSSIGKEGISSTGSYDSIVNHKISVDVSLFHEMNHWFHYMRYPDRYEYEFNAYKMGIHINDTNFVSAGLPYAVSAISSVVPTTVGALGIYYWGVIGGWINIDISESKWHALKSDGINNELRPDFEEIRNILGLKNVGLPPGLVFYNGDDLSENLYRMCVGLPLRFGYGADEYYEDSRVIDKVLSCCNFWKMYYNFSPKRAKHAGFSYDNQSNLQGIGRCKILP